MQIASSGKQGSKGVRVKPLFKYGFVNMRYRYPNPTLEFGYRYLLGRVSVPLVLHQVSVPREGYRYPSPPLGLEYRYWYLSTDTSCLKTVFGPP
ncbi:hypothetical protein GQ457_10G009240 [Hibiscus cannabinus]